MRSDMIYTIGDYMLIVTITLSFLCPGISFKRTCSLIFLGTEERLIGLWFFFLSFLKMGTMFAFSHMKISWWHLCIDRLMFKVQWTADLQWMLVTIRAITSSRSPSCCPWHPCKFQLDLICGFPDTIPRCLGGVFQLLYSLSLLPPPVWHLFAQELIQANLLIHVLVFLNIRMDCSCSWRMLCFTGLSTGSHSASCPSHGIASQIWAAPLQT